MQVRKDWFHRVVFWGFKTFHLKLKAVGVCCKAGDVQLLSSRCMVGCSFPLEILCKWGRTICSLKNSLFYCYLKNVAVTFRNVNFLVDEIALRVGL